MRIEAQHQPILSVTEAALVLGCSVASVYDLSKVLRFKAASPIERTRESAPCATVTVDTLETTCGAALLLVRNR